MKKAFTLVEVLIVVVIIGVITAIAIPNFIRIVNNAREASLKANMHTLNVVTEYFNVISGGYYPGGIDTEVRQVNPDLDGTPDGYLSIASGARTPPFPSNALLLPHQGFKNPFGDTIAVENLPSGPPPVPPSGCVYYTGYKLDGTPTTEGESADKYIISAYGANGPMSVTLP